MHNPSHVARSKRPWLSPAPWRGILSIGHSVGILIALCATACTSFEHRLLPEQDIPILKKLGQICDQLPQRVVLVPTGQGKESLDVAIHEYGSGQEDRIIVAIHGVLSDYRCWRYVTGGLGGEYDMWAIDMPGCGESDCPSPFVISKDAYSPDWLARHVLEALRAQLAKRSDTVRLTLACHSLGGAVALRMLGNLQLKAEFADVLEHVDGAVLIAPLDFAVGRVDPTLAELARFRDLQVSLGTATGVVRRLTAEAIYRSGVDASRMPVEEFDRTFEILIDPPRRHAMQAMLQRAVPRNEDASIIWESALALAADYANVDVPCVIVWGEQDETLISASGYVLQHKIPEAKLRLISDCMHCVPIEAPLICANLIHRLVREGIDSWPELERLTHRPAMRVAWTGELEGTRNMKRESISRRREQPVSWAPSSVSVLSGRDLQRSGARYISDALRILPGVEIQRISATESGVALRGYVDSATATQGTLGLVDGRQVYNPFLGNVLWDQLAVRLEDVDRIEVIRGPGSFIHGPNAMHGVVSIQTKSPLDYTKDSVSATSHLGNYGSVVAGTTVVHRTESSGFRTSAQWEDINQFDSARPEAQNKGFFESSYEAELDGDPNHVFGLSGGVSQQQFDILLPSLDVLPPTTLDNTGQDLFAMAKYRNGDPNRHSVEAQVAWSGFDSKSRPQAYYSPFTVDLDTFDIDLQGTWNASQHLLTAGAGYRVSSVETSDLDVSSGRHEVNQGWVFFQEEVGLSDDISFTLGLRADQHSVTGSDFSPRAAVVWEVRDNQFVRMSAGRGFRNPSLRELWFDMPVTGVPNVPGTITIAGNNQLNAESLTSFEVGYSGSWGKLLAIEPGTVIETNPLWSSHQFEAGISAFYNMIDDLISFERDSNNPLRVMPVNQGDEEAYGFELECRYVFSDSASLFGNYSFAERRDRETGERNELVPANTINSGLAFSKGRLSAMLWANYYDRTELNGIGIDSYVLVNGSVNYGFLFSNHTAGKVFLRVTNLLDDLHREHPEGDAYGMILSCGFQVDW